MYLFFNPVSSYRYMKCLAGASWRVPMTVGFKLQNKILCSSVIKFDSLRLMGIEFKYDLPMIYRIVLAASRLIFVRARYLSWHEQSFPLFFCQRNSISNKLKHYTDFSKRLVCFLLYLFSGNNWFNVLKTAKSCL